MTLITVDANDVEALVVQAQLAKQMAEYAAVHKVDAAVMRTRDTVKDAIWRLNNAVQKSRRIDDPGEHEPLSEQALDGLDEICRLSYSLELEGYFCRYDTIISTPGFDELRAKGCVQICNTAIVAAWKDGERRSTNIEMLVRLTSKGRSLARKGLDAPVPAIAPRGVDSASTY